MGTKKRRNPKNSVLIGVNTFKEDLYSRETKSEI